MSTQGNHNQCEVFMMYEDRIIQQMNIAGMVLRAINKLLGNTKYTDKYIHSKCKEFSEAGLEACGKIDKYMLEMRNRVTQCS